MTLTRKRLLKKKRTREKVRLANSQFLLSFWPQRPSWQDSDCFFFQICLITALRLDLNLQWIGWNKSLDRKSLHLKRTCLTFLLFERCNNLGSMGSICSGSKWQQTLQWRWVEDLVRDLVSSESFFSTDFALFACDLQKVWGQTTSRLTYVLNIYIELSFHSIYKEYFTLF